MNLLSRLWALATVACLAAVSSACSTVIKPVRPSTAWRAEGPPLPGVRFDGEETVIREPGMPVSPSRSWQREVANYTAASLNTVLGTDENAPPARTTVSFELASPSVMQIGTWKEMTITLSSTLPDGTVVRSQPVVGKIDDNVEYAIGTSLGVGATVLEVTVGVASILFFFSATPEQAFTTGVVLVGALVGGILLKLGQSSWDYVVAGAEETRWSDLHARAIRQHAADIRANIGRGPPPGAPLPPGTAPPPPDPSDPPPLLDPAEPR